MIFTKGNPTSPGRYMALLDISKWGKTPYRVVEAEWNGKTWTGLVESAQGKVTGYSEIEIPDWFLKDDNPK